MPAYSKIHSDGANPEDSVLVVRNVEIHDRKGRKVRTSMRLEPYVWESLQEIARREGRTHHELCDIISRTKPVSATLTAAVRLFILMYFRYAATEEGHRDAGHGKGDNSLFDRVFVVLSQPKASSRRNRSAAAAPPPEG